VHGSLELASVAIPQSSVRDAMTTQYQNPLLTIMVHQETPYRGQWIIVKDTSLQYIDRHEVEQHQGERKLVERISLKSLAEAEAFSTYLCSHGWSLQRQA
jgi:hypothetical protein